MPHIPVCVAGATGLVGQVLLARLVRHPWFRVRDLLASNHRECLTYREAVAGRFAVAEAEAYADRKLRALDAAVDCPVIFSCLPSGPARTWEQFWRRRGHLVVTCAADHRLDPDVPLLVPEINAHHFRAPEPGDTSGVLIATPNCAVAGFALVAGVLARVGRLHRAVVTTCQSVSGAGLKGLSAHAAVDNLIPFILGEEEKWLREPQKILGEPQSDGYCPYSLALDVTCIRVPIRRGHLVSVTMDVDPALTPEAAREALQAFEPAPEIRDLPSCPSSPIRVLTGPDRPQPALDLDADGMSVAVGRVRGKAGRIQWVVLVDNLQRGAAGNAVLAAELAVTVRNVSGGAP